MQSGQAVRRVSHWQSACQPSKRGPGCKRNICLSGYGMLSPGSGHPAATTGLLGLPFFGVFLQSHHAKCLQSIQLEEKLLRGVQRGKAAHLGREKGDAPGEARTHGLQIMRLTRCLLRYRGKCSLLKAGPPLILLARGRWFGTLASGHA